MHWSHHQRWAIRARQEGYPTCKFCGEPLPKADWKSGAHLSCQMAENKLNERNRDDEWREQWKRQNGE